MREGMDGEPAVECHRTLGKVGAVGLAHQGLLVGAASAGEADAMSRLASRAFARALLGSFSLLLGAAVAEAQKTDSVWIRNGDRITGEVKSLSRALLKYSTDDLGTIYIEWDHVDRISSRATFEVQVTSGIKHYGPLGLGPKGTLVLGLDTLLLADIVTITPIKNTLLARMDGYLDLGFSYQKAHKTLQLSTGAKVVYRGPVSETGIEASTFREDRDDTPETTRLTSDLTQRFLIGNLWSTGFVVGYEQNEELDLAARVRVGAFGARTLSRNNHVDFSAIAGPVVTREKYVSNDSTSTSFEGLLSVVFRAFRYDSPKLDASVSSQLYPSFTVQGRVRWQNDLRVSYELVKDFMITTTLFDSFDNKPQSMGAPKNDFGTTLAISWTF